MSELSVGQLKGLTVNNNIITLPSGHKLYSPGHIIQVQQSTATGPVIYSTSSWVDVVTLNITPTSSNSKFLLNSNFHFSGKGGIKFVRNSTDITSVTADGSGPYQIWGPWGQNGPNDSSQRSIQHLSFIDSPSTTSTITYRLQAKSYSYSSGSGQIMMGENGTSGIFYVMEIAQ